MNNLASKIFKYRSYTPIPFLLVMIFFQRATIESMMIGFAMILIGESFRLWGVAYAGSETRTTGEVGGTYLVVSGAFAYVRNPLYLGNILIYLGVGVMSMALFPYLQIVAFIFFYVQYYFIISEEEEYLKKTFKEQYEEYKRNVPKLIPRLTAFKRDDIKQPPLNLKAGLRSERRTFQAIGSVVIILIILFYFGV
ncbi:MAG: isoprenylcysteine carboxylmethyltransferase family protein [Chlorobi bacterium]|nr:isoprenylcysteine carboxylmethyltransferase family protein [Chlorobiota bacterium]